EALRLLILPQGLSHPAEMVERLSPARAVIHRSAQRQTFAQQGLGLAILPHYIQRVTEKVEAECQPAWISDYLSMGGSPLPGQPHVINLYAHPCDGCLLLRTFHWRLPVLKQGRIVATPMHGVSNGGKFVTGAGSSATGSVFNSSR